MGSDRLRADLYDTRLQVLIEAKGATTRLCIRLAVGQLVDYRRYLSPRPRLAMLLPVAPPEDLAAIPHEVGIGLIWAVGDDFEGSIGGELINRDPPSSEEAIDSQSRRWGTRASASF